MVDGSAKLTMVSVRAMGPGSTVSSGVSVGGCEREDAEQQC